MTLYQIVSEINDAVVGAVNEETGEVEFNLDRLETLAMEKSKKIENICLLIKNTISDIAAIKAEEMSLSARRTVLENKVEHLRSYLADTVGGEEFSSARFTLSWKASQETKVTDLSAIPDRFKKAKTTYTPDKVAIKKAILSGEKVEGAEVITKTNPQIK